MPCNITPLTPKYLVTICSFTPQYRVITHLTVVEETVRVWTGRLARRAPDRGETDEAAALVAEGGLLREFDRPLQEMRQATQTLVTEGGVSEWYTGSWVTL